MTLAGVRDNQIKLMSAQFCNNRSIHSKPIYVYSRCGLSEFEL